MKTLITVLGFLVLMTSTAFAQNDYQNPSPYIRAKILELTMKDPVVKAAMAQTAKDVSISLKKCTLNIQSVEGENVESSDGKKTIDGSIKLSFSCNNTEMEAASYIMITASVYSSYLSLDSILFGKAG